MLGAEARPARSVLFRGRRPCWAAGAARRSDTPAGPPRPRAGVRRGLRPNQKLRRPKPGSPAASLGGAEGSGLSGSRKRSVGRGAPSQCGASRPAPPGRPGPHSGRAGPEGRTEVRSGWAVGRAPGPGLGTGRRGGGGGRRGAGGADAGVALQVSPSGPLGALSVPPVHSAVPGAGEPAKTPPRDPSAPTERRPEAEPRSGVRSVRRERRGAGACGRLSRPPPHGARARSAPAVSSASGHSSTPLGW